MSSAARSAMLTTEFATFQIGMPMRFPLHSPLALIIITIIMSVMNIISSAF
jgi:hypothetical protein